MPEELHIVTEVGVFGDLNIPDPTAEKVKKKQSESISQSDFDELIESIVKSNNNR